MGCAIEVHKGIGPGLLESAYEECLCFELSQGGLSFRRQVELPVIYKDVRLDCGYRLDLLIENEVIIEKKPWTPFSQFMKHNYFHTCACLIIVSVLF